MIEVGKNKFIDPNIFWVYMLIYYISFIVISISIFSLLGDKSLFNHSASKYVPYFVLNEKTEKDFIIVNYYMITSILILVFNAVCCIKFPYFRKINPASAKLILPFLAAIILWALGVTGFYYDSRRWGEGIPTAFLHAAWIPFFNIAIIVLKIDNGKKFSDQH